MLPEQGSSAELCYKLELVSTRSLSPLWPVTAFQLTKHIFFKARGEGRSVKAEKVADPAKVSMPSYTGIFHREIFLFLQ